MKITNIRTRASETGPEAPVSMPTCRITTFGRCASTAIGHVTAAPPISAINCLRLMPASALDRYLSCPQGPPHRAD